LNGKTYQNLPLMKCVEFVHKKNRTFDRTEDPWFDSSYGQTQRISKAANFDKFFDSNPFTSVFNLTETQPETRVFSKNPTQT
jgi:hypothetical protein